jgi:hypothetical protein
MQYRILSLQESFGTTGIQTFKEAKGVQSRASSYDIGGQLPTEITSESANNPSIAPLISSSSIMSNRDAQQKSDRLIVVVSVVLLLGISAVVYYKYKENLRKKKDTNVRAEVFDTYTRDTAPKADAGLQQ